jgi:uncharacterized SAM-binding protein YcdF (DUF218 family)
MNPSQDVRRPTAPRRRPPAAVALGLGLGLAAAALGLDLGGGALLTWAAYRFRAEDAPARSDALVVPLDGRPERPAKAAELYARGLAPLVLIARTRATPEDATAYARDALARGGVPPGAIRVLPGGVVRGTRDEALRLRDYARAHPVRRVTVVTTAFHSARAGRAFRGALRGTGVEVRVAAAEDTRFREADWYTCRDGAALYGAELIKTVGYRLLY